jgi:hypothetical protein
MSLRFSYANLVGIRCGRNIEKLVGGFADKALLLDCGKSVIEAKLLGKLVPRRPFPTSFSLPRSIFSGEPL